jgi:hypothetical protein
MTSITIYVEGGGDSTNGKALLRQGFDALLTPQKEAARVKRLRWKLTPCGGREPACDAFCFATTKCTREEIVALLVDAEEAVANTAPVGRVEHLVKAYPLKRENLKSANAERVHLMTQCMEAWIVADVKALTAFYGKDFHAGALCKRDVLDDEPKAALYASLEAATKATQKGSYGKIKHASELLKRIRPTMVAARCVSFQHFTKWLDATIAAA